MSMDYWAIQGYAITFNPDWVKEELGYMDLIDVFNYLKSQNKLEDACISYSDNGEGEQFILYSANAYFQMTEQEKHFTCIEDIAVAMYELLKSVLDPTKISCENFKEKIDWISTYGCR